MTQAAESLALRQPLQQLARDASKMVDAQAKGHGHSLVITRKRREIKALSLFLVLDVFTW